MHFHTVTGKVPLQLQKKIGYRPKWSPTHRPKPVRAFSKVFCQVAEKKNMATRDQRKHPRVPTSNLISFKLYDDNGALLNQSMARALNISQSGILIETAHLITAQRISLMSADTGDKLVKIKGCVVYSRENGISMYETGISFEGTEEENVAFAKKLVKVFHRRKKGLLVAVNQSP